MTNNIIMNDSKIFVDADSRYTLLKELPPAVDRGAVFTHFKQAGHWMEDITTEELARFKIRCPIYWDNNARRDIIFENYLCACGRLFMFLAEEQPGKKVASNSGIGVCPCRVCLHYSEGIGCKV